MSNIDIKSGSMAHADVVAFIDSSAFSCDVERATPKNLTTIK